MNGKQSGLKTLAVVFLVLFVILVATNFVGPVVSAIESGDDQAYADALFFNFLGVCVVVVVLVGGFVTMIPAAIRRRRVRQRIASSDVLWATGRGNVDLRSKLRSGNFLDMRQSKKNIPGWTFAISATSSGVRFWSGMINPVVIADFPWLEVERVATGRVEVGLRYLSAIELRMKPRGTEETVLLFALGGEGILTGFPRGRSAVEEVAQAFEELRLSSVSSRPD